MELFIFSLFEKSDKFLSCFDTSIILDIGIGIVYQSDKSDTPKREQSVYVLVIVCKTSSEAYDDAIEKVIPTKLLFGRVLTVLQ